MYRRVCLLCAAVLAVSVNALLFAASHSLEQFSQTYALPSHGRILLENLNGDVRITAWDRDEVKVEAIKRASNRERLADARIIVDTSDGALAIRTHYSGADAEDPASVEYRITVPRHANLEDVKLVNGELSIAGLAGDVKASALNGSIHAENLEGEADLSTVNGQLEAGFNRLDRDSTVSLSSVNGPITLSLPADAKASVSASNLSGGIRSDFGRPARILAAGGQRLRAVIKGGGARIRLHNVNGGISITGPGRRARTT
jgi:DUF4097 and DUF4098 domain-containing protein YvlB